VAAEPDELVLEPVSVDGLSSVRAAAQQRRARNVPVEAAEPDELVLEPVLVDRPSSVQAAVACNVFVEAIEPGELV
jgi:hypothetical protein